jgi:hypothetical protein
MLPCWWGFYPGITKWSDVQNLYHAIGVNPEAYKNTYTTKIHLDEQNINIGTGYILNSDIIDAISIGGVQIRDNKIVHGEPDYQQVFANYLLPKMLSDFGKPEEVWVRTFPGSPEGGPIPFYVLLNYFQKGISVEYNGDVQNVGAEYSMCPQKAGINLFLWSPEKSDPNIVSKSRDEWFIRPDDFSGFQSLEKATGVTIEEFYQTFKSSQNQVCLTTQPDSWLP